MTNRSTLTTSDEGVDADALPPRESDGRLRVLVLTGHTLGWRTYAASVASTTARREDIDAVHVHAVQSRLISLAGAKVTPRRKPRGRLDPHLRRTRGAQLVHGRWLKQHIDMSRFDVVHVTPQLVAPAVLRRQGRPATSLGIDATVSQAKAQRNSLAEDVVWERFAPLLALERRVLDSVSSIVCMSAWAADALPAAVKDKAVVIAPSVDVPTPVLDRTRNDHPVRLLFVGNDWERKGGQRLLRWHQDHLVGRAELHVCSSSAPLDRSAAGVVWHGAVDREALLRELMPTMDAMALPTRSDMSPWAVVEAVASGLPVISSAIGGLEELVVHGETGYLLDPTDDRGFVSALLNFVDDRDLRLRLRSNTIELARSRLGHRRLGDRLVEHWHGLARASRR